MTNPEVQKQNLLCYLEREREQWLPLQHRAQRAGGMNAEANLAEAQAMTRIDALLDELGSLAIDNITEGSPSNG